MSSLLYFDVPWFLAPFVARQRQLGSLVKSADLKLRSLGGWGDFSAAGVCYFLSAYALLCLLQDEREAQVRSVVRDAQVRSTVTTARCVVPFFL